MITSTGKPNQGAYDVVIVGAGFYGIALASRFGAAGASVLVCECGKAPMERASAVNQARVHTGFHYPRSYVTALRSLHNYERFIEDFAPAVRRDFKMLYAVARHGTKVNAKRFIGMYEAMKAPIERATASQRALFDNSFIEDIYACDEYAFDYYKLREILLARMASSSVELALETRVDHVRPLSGGGINVRLSGGGSVEAGRVFNITYSRLNDLLVRSGAKPFALKHELVEIALLYPPRVLNGLGVTVMDGPFFSVMPWPAAGAYSLTHVRYTPHCSWTDETAKIDAYGVADKLPKSTRWRHMMCDARRFMPGLGEARWQRSLFDVKTVPIKNERNDGRPILLTEHADLPGLYSVLGSKIDNIYDLYEALE